MALFSKWDLTVDVVCVGSGLGGIGAAIVAHDAGKKCVVLEKAPKLGGICAYSGGEVFVPNNHLMEGAGLRDSDEEGMKYLRFLAAGYADEKLQQELFQTGKIAAKYFQEKAGVRWKLIKDFPDYHHPHAPGTAAAGRYLEVQLFNGADLGEWQQKTYLSPHMPNAIEHDELFAWGGFVNIMKWDFKLMGKRFKQDARGFGPGMMAYFIKAAMIDRQIPAYVNTPAKQVLVENGEVVGVRAQKDGKDFFIRAKKGVVLATGGYDWHPEMPRYYEQLPAIHSVVQPTVEGDGFIMGNEIGAAIAAVPANNMGIFFGYQVPGEEQEGKPMWRNSWEGGFPHAIWVNAAGMRFGDESFYRDYIPKVKAWNGETQTQPNFPPYFIFDSNYREKYPLGTFLPVQDFPDGLVTKADTLAELAQKLGIDAKGLEATVERFNKFAADGVDPDFGRGKYPWAAMMTGDRTRKNPNLGPLDKGPYYGLKLQPTGVGINSAGLKTNADAQVIHVRGQPIPGLYAVGNAAAPLDIGAGYQSGLSNLRGMAGGYRAGKHAAAR